MRQEIHATAEKSQKTMRRVGDELSVQNDGLKKVVQDGNDKTWQTMADQGAKIETMAVQITAEFEKAEAERAAAAARHEKANAARDEIIRCMEAERDAREAAEIAKREKDFVEMKERAEARKLKEQEKEEERAQMQEARLILTRSSSPPAAHAAHAASAALLR